MKSRFLVSVFLILSFFFSTNVQAQGEDKIAHLGVSYALAFSFTSMLKYQAGLSTWESIALGGMTALFLGFAKEMSDSSPDEGDLWANGIGVLGASLFHVAIEF